MDEEGRCREKGWYFPKLQGRTRCCPSPSGFSLGFPAYVTGGTSHPSRLQQHPQEEPASPQPLLTLPTPLALRSKLVISP